jgi:hypothetical protein
MSKEKIINIAKKEKYCGKYFSVGFTQNGGTHGTEIECNMSKRIENIVNNRKYFDTYLSVGFTQDGDGTTPRPPCILRTEIPQNISTLPSN